MFERLERSSGNIVGYRARGKLTHEDYTRFVPEMEDLIAAVGPVRILVVLDNFQGWDALSAWEDFRFGMEHNDDFERIAIVGETRWHEMLARLARPFVRGEMRYFAPGDADKAWAWLWEGRPEQ